MKKVKWFVVALVVALLVVFSVIFLVNVCSLNEKSKTLLTRQDISNSEATDIYILLKLIEVL
jgi:hypothetical protein